MVFSIKAKTESTHDTKAESERNKHTIFTEIMCSMGNSNFKYKFLYHSNGSFKVIQLRTRKGCCVEHELSTVSAVIPLRRRNRRSELKCAPSNGVTERRSPLLNSSASVDSSVCLLCAETLMRRVLTRLNLVGSAEASGFTTRPAIPLDIRPWISHCLSANIHNGPPITSSPGQLLAKESVGERWNLHSLLSVYL